MKYFKDTDLMILLLNLSILFTSCYTSDKAQKQVNKADSKYPEIVAKLARDKYPCTDLLKNDTAIVFKDSLVFVDIDCPDVIKSGTVIKTDTVNNVITKTIRVPVNVPVQTKYINRWYEDSAKLKLASVAINKAITANEKLQATNDKLNKKVANKSKENWFWRIVAFVFIALWAWRKYRQLTTIKFK